MKTSTNIIYLTLLALSLVVTSCRDEETEFIQEPAEETLAPNSPVASLMQRTATNDGSFDNILDGASCFNIEFPVTVYVNGEEIDVNSEDDLDDVEDIIDEFEDDNDEIVIQYPIVIILADFTEITVNSETELENLADDCGEDNSPDDDIECIDFQYPITASLFNTNNELIESITITNDEQMYDFIDELDEDTIVTINFPINVVLSDGTSQSIASLTELQAVIQNAEDDCDEDDDNDFDDDDCDSCTDDALTDLLTGCSDWIVDKLERNDVDLEDTYIGYVFNFAADGSLTVDYSSGTYPGTWSATGTANNMTVTIDIPALPACNDNWTLHEIDQVGEYQVDLRIGDDRLRFESDCVTGGGGGINDSALVAALTNGDWFITYYFDDTEETTDYADFVFNFASDGTATATDSSGSTDGIWSTSAGDETELELNLNFGLTVPLDDLAEDWDVLEVTNDIIRLKDLSGGDGSTDFLTFERSLGGGGGGGDDLSATLSDGFWIVGSYTDDGFDETADYAGYQLDFDAAGTVVADNGTPINGTWAVMNSGNILSLDFADGIPFDEFNDDWDVISVSDTEVVLQDVSGGGGGTDVLTLQKL